MPKLKVLSGKDVLKIFFELGFEKLHQKGSHAKLIRFIDDEKQILTVPVHREMGTGTLKAIFRQSSRYIQKSVLLTYFYHEQ